MRFPLSLPYALLFASLLTFITPFAREGVAQGDSDRIDVVSAEEPVAIPANLSLRARVVAIDQKEHLPTTIRWRHSGQGLGGEVEHGILGDKLELLQWTEPVAVASLYQKNKAPRRCFLSFYAGARGEKADRVTHRMEGFSTGVELEVELSAGEKVIRTLRLRAPDGGTFTLVLPLSKLAGGKPTDAPEFTTEVEGVLEYAQRRAQHLEGLPWAGEPVPRRYSIITDLMGYGPGFSLRHSDPNVINAELRSLHQLGVNGLRAAPPYLVEEVAAGRGEAANFRRTIFANAGSFPVVRYRRGKAAEEGAGCPYGLTVPELTRESVAKARENLLSLPFPEVWALTIDEIGSVFDETAEGKSHPAGCERCGEAYRAFLRARGISPQELGAKSWDQIKPLDLWNRDPNVPKPDLAQPGAILAAYYTRVFNNHSTAIMFRSMRKAFEDANQSKAAALAAGRADAPEARQPWVYTFALRANTFLMRGHSLDFFDFYREADNAFVYETSNRDARAWGWDSYLCDVGRVVKANLGHELGIYIKPHRGAPIQRALAAASRGFKMIYWYTYGPEYAKGDTFSSREPVLEATSKAARLLAASEEVLYGAQWVRPAEVAIIKPFSLNALIQGGLRVKEWAEPLASAAWEDTKWTYSALAHEHIPVDPIDETMVIEQDLSRYKVIYIPSPVLVKKAAEKLEQWVKNGGTLYTNASGLSRDEAGQPLDLLLPVLGLTKRDRPEVWTRTPLYTSVSYNDFNPGDVTPLPEGVGIPGLGLAKGEPLRPVVGREVLHLAPGAEELARFEDGGIAISRNRYGKGSAYVVGFFPGLEYSAPVRQRSYDMQRDLGTAVRQTIARPALEAGIKIPVDPGSPLVEAALVQNGNARAVPLMNWGYRIGTHRVRLNEKGQQQIIKALPELIPLSDLKIRVKDVAGVTKARSVGLGKDLSVKAEGRDIWIHLPELQEGDVLLLE